LGELARVVLLVVAAWVGFFRVTLSRLALYWRFWGAVGELGVALRDRRWLERSVFEEGEREMMGGLFPEREVDSFVPAPTVYRSSSERAVN
jgi:hypothetical protein